MKKVLILLAAVLTLWSCGTPRLAQSQVSQSAWVSVSPGTVDGVEGNVIMNLVFTSDTDVKVLVAVQSGNQVIVKPYEYARGTYAIDNTVKNGNGLTLKLKTIEGKDLTMKGTCEKGKALVLITNDNVTRLFGRIKDFKFE